MKTYSFRQARHLLKTVYKWFQKHQDDMDSQQKNKLDMDLKTLDDAIVSRDQKTVNSLTNQLETFADRNCKKGIFDYTKELVVALVFALIIAVVVRQMWFELYEIPSGSMRPTLREQDHLTVSKTQFGINIPLEAAHFYFDPDLVQRTSILIFTGANIPSLDQVTNYFGIFPYTKRYVKRLLGKPGDSIYFYGGKLYGVDANGQPITELQDSPWMQKLEYVPMLTFDGVISGAQNQADFKMMNQLIGRLLFSRSGVKGQIYNGKEWVKDNPAAQLKPHDTIETYSDFWGMRNYAMARLVTYEELQQNPRVDLTGIEKGVLYLELQHSPSFSYPAPVFQQGYPYLLNPPISVIPLQQSHIDSLMDNMYTARFVMKNEHAGRYSPEKASEISADSPEFSGIPDGKYELYNGIAYKVDWGGIRSTLAKDEPIYSKDPLNVQKLFNLGIDFSTQASPRAQGGRYFPHRYAYFRDGDLYVLGAPLLKKGDPALANFLEREKAKQEHATSDKPYVAFHDFGPPLKEDGSYDVGFIRTFGVTVPQGQYFVLGDNHAMSSDSRMFGFVPADNLQGVPCYIIWPPGERWNVPEQKPYPLFTVPRLIVWGIALLVACLWYAYYRYSMSVPYIKRNQVSSQKSWRGE